MKASVGITLSLSLLYGCATAVPVAVKVDVPAPIPPKLMEPCKAPSEYTSSLIEEVILTSVDNTEKHINCMRRHNTLVEVLLERNE